MARRSNSNQEQDQDRENEAVRETGDDAESSSGFSARNLTRFAAVALFVILGSFAVMHSLRNKPSDKEKPVAQDGESETAQPGDADPDNPGAAENALLNAVATGDNQDPTENSDSAETDAAGKTESAKKVSKQDQQVAILAAAPGIGADALRKFIVDRDPIGSPSPLGGPEPSGIGSDTRFDPKSLTGQAPPIQLSDQAKPKVDSNAFTKPESETLTPAGGTNPKSLAGALAGMGGPAPSQTLRATTSPDEKGKEETSKGFSPPPAQDSGGVSKSFGAADILANKTAAPEKRNAGIPPQDRYASAGPIVGQGSARMEPPRPAFQENGNNESGPPQAPDLLSDARQAASEMGQAARSMGQRTGEAMENAMDRTRDSMSQNQRNFRDLIGEPNPSSPSQPADFGSRGTARERGFETVERSSAPTAIPDIPDRDQQVATGSTGSPLRPDTGPLGSPPPMGRSPERVSVEPINQPVDRGISGGPPTDRGSDLSIRSRATVDGLTPQNRSNDFNGLRGGRSEVPALPASTAIGNGPPSTATAARPRALGDTATLDVPGRRELEGAQTPALTIEKRSPNEVQVNQSAPFEIVIKNVGRVAVDDVQVFDEVPAGTEFEGATPPPANMEGGKLRWDLGAMGPGAEKRIGLQLKPTRPGEIGSVAQVTFASRTAMRTKVTQPVLQIEHRTKPKVLIGDDVIFDVVITNKGDGPARNVLIQEDVPPQLSFQGGFRELEYEVGTLPPGGSRNVRLALKAAQAGKLKNVMFASAEGGLKTQHDLDMEIVAPTLKVASEGPIRRFLGRNMTHAVSIGNQGTATATNIDLIAQLPQGVRYVGSNNQGTYNPRNHSVFWSLAALPANSQEKVELTTTPIAVGNHPIKIVAMADLNLRNEAEQPLSIEHLVDVFFSIDDVVDPIEVGSETQYRVQIVNQGTKTATEVQLAIDFTNGLKPTAVNGSLANNIVGQKIQFQPIANLPPGQKIEMLVTAVGQAVGDHRVSITMQSADRPTPVAKQETTRVYSDR